MNEEQRKSMTRPALFANRVFVARQGNGVRVSFGETVDEETFYSTAVMMADADAIALRNLLNELIPPADKQN